MKFKAPAIEIPQANPFGYDLLSRVNSATGLKQFVENLDESFVLGLDAPWGTGKTTFLMMWREMLRAAGFHCLYFSAWENDFSDSPLVSLIAEIGNDANLGKTSGQTKVQQSYQKVKELGAALVKTAAPAVLKIVTSGIVDLEGIGDELGKLAEDVATKKIEKYEADKNTIHEFRKHLSKLVTEYSHATRAAPPKSVIFIIDELDRCRPHYAIELLEKIKHLFSVEGLVFVLAMDKVQLGHSIKALYGAGFDAEGYLKRFIDLEFPLPKGEIDVFMRSQLARFGITELFAKRMGNPQVEMMDLQETLVSLFSLFSFSLRTQEQCFTQIAVIMGMTERNHHIFAPLLGILICLRVKDQSLCAQYIQGQVSPKQVLDYLASLPDFDKLSQSETAALIEAYLVIGMRPGDKRNREGQRYYNVANTKGNDEGFHERAKIISRRLQGLTPEMDPTGFLSKKIEFAHQFVKPD